MTDNVNHPAHYTQGGVECIEALKAATVHKKGIEAICVANIIKYLWRYEEKNGKEDVEKARWYLEYLLKEVDSAHKGEDALFNHNSSNNIGDCFECKYDNIGFEDDGITWKEPCKFCKNGIQKDAPEYETAKLKWEPKENK